MEAVRHIIDGQVLNGIIPLPNTFYSKRVEIIVFPIQEATGTLSLSGVELDNILKGSITESLIGVVPNSGRDLEDYRAERLVKYDCAD